MSLSTNINTKSLAVYSTSNLLLPAEGPRAIPLLLDFSVSPSFSLNLQNSEALKRLTMIQGVYIDNALGTANVKVYCPITGQVIVVAPGHQAFKTLFCPNPAAIMFSSDSGIVLKFQLTNFPVVNDDWSTT